MCNNTSGDYKIQYLQMIEDVITRMSSTSAIIKGFAVTVAIGICTMSTADFVEAWLLWIFILPLFSLIGLDIYYLSLERKYRYLYKMVCDGKEALTFSLDISDKNIDIKKSKSGKWDCLKSVSIWMFYVPVIIMYVSVCIWVTCLK